MDDKLQMWAVLHELIADTQRSGHVRHPNAKERLIDFIWLNRVELSNAAVAMSAQAPGMEAMLRECRPYVAMEAGEQDNNTLAEALTLLEQIDAALRAAERVKA